MRTSLIEIKEIENWLFGRGNIQDRLLTEANILSNPDLMEKAQQQAKTYKFIHLYGREKLLKEIKVVEKQLFTGSKYLSFQKRIRSIFKSS